MLGRRLLSVQGQLAQRQTCDDTVLELSNQKKSGARVVVTGCMAERYGSELAESLPEADHIAGFGVPIMLTKNRFP